MSTMIRRMDWAAVLCFAAIFIGCGGSEDPPTVAKSPQAEQETQETQETQVKAVSDAPVALSGEIVEDEPAKLDANNTAESPEGGIIRAGGMEETTVSGIQTVAGIGDLFNETTLDGSLVFDEDEGDAEADTPEEKIVAPQKGSAEFFISEITKLRLQPLPKTDDPKKALAAQQSKQLKIIELAENAMRLTHRDKRQQRVFDVAVSKLLEARLQLALSGHRESIDSLYEHADSLYQRDPQSAVAAEGMYTLVNLAYAKTNTAAMAGTLAKDPRWLQEFARQAEVFAVKFPKEQRRSIPLLFTAAEICEMYGLFPAAIQCYSVLIKNYPDHPATEASVAVVRRLRMQGKRIKLYGTTLAGKKLSLDQFAGKTTLVFFWSTEAQPAIDQISEVIDAFKKYGRERLGVIGVCLDNKREVVEAFLAKKPLPWPNIFHPNEQKRGWNNPIVKFYGVRRIPALWIIDSSGLVVTTTIQPGQLDEGLANVFKPSTAARPRSRK